MDPIFMGVATAFFEDEIDRLNGKTYSGISGVIELCRGAGYSSLEEIPQPVFDRFCERAGMLRHAWTREEKDAVIRGIENKL